MDYTVPECTWVTLYLSVQCNLYNGRMYTYKTRRMYTGYTQDTPDSNMNTTRHATGAVHQLDKA